MKYAAALLIALVLNAGANLLMKVGMKSQEDRGGILREGPLAAASTVIHSPTLMLGLACFVVNAAFYMYALQSRALKISIAYPIMVGGGFALIALIAHLHPSLAERLTGRQWLGVLVVLVGIMLIASQAEGST